MAILAPRAVTIAALAGAAGLALAAPASAASRHHRHYAADDGVSYEHVGRAPRGGQALVSDGPGTGYGFHRLPGHYRVAAAAERGRQAAAVRSAVIDDAVESTGPFWGGIAGPNGYGPTGQRRAGVFSYPDGYGSPFFAGYYGEGTGTDYGPFGHAYED